MYNYVMYNYIEKLCQILLAQVEQLRMGLDATEHKAQYWQQVAQKVSSVSVTNAMTASSLASGNNDADTYSHHNNPDSSTNNMIHMKEYTLEVIEKNRLKDENSILRDQLSIAKTESMTAKNELRESQQTMQQEFASLW